MDIITGIILVSIICFVAGSALVLIATASSEIYNYCR